MFFTSQNDAIQRDNKTKQARLKKSLQYWQSSYKLNVKCYYTPEAVRRHLSTSVFQFKSVSKSDLRFCEKIRYVTTTQKSTGRLFPTSAPAEPRRAGGLDQARAQTLKTLVA